MRHVAFDEGDDKGLDLGSCTLLVSDEHYGTVYKKVRRLLYQVQLIQMHRPQWSIWIWTFNTEEAQRK